MGRYSNRTLVRLRGFETPELLNGSIVSRNGCGGNRARSRNASPYHASRQHPLCDIGLRCRCMIVPGQQRTWRSSVSRGWCDWRR